MNETVTLNSRIDGQGAPILLLHGLFGSHRNWFSVQRQLARMRWQVHGLDLRNHGLSPWSDRMDYAVMSDDVLAYLDQHRIERAVILGHSMGGKVAMSLALRNPDRIQALVVVDIAPVAYQPTLRPFLDGMRQMPLAQVNSRRDADQLLEASVPNPGIRGFLLQNLVTSDGGGYSWRINLNVIDTELDVLGDIPAGAGTASGEVFDRPVQAIYGTQSEYMQAAAREAMVKQFPGTEFASVAGAGHWVHAEQPERFFQLLSDFLGRLDVNR